MGKFIFRRFIGSVKFTVAIAIIRFITSGIEIADVEQIFIHLKDIVCILFS